METVPKSLPKLKAVFHSKTKDGTTGIMGGVKLIPGFPFNLISGTKLLTLGFKISGDARGIKYKKDGIKITFDIKVNTPERMVLATRLKRTATEVGGAVASVKTVSVKTAHDQLGHMSEKATRKTAKALGWTVTKGTLGNCESCAIGNSF